MFWPQRLQEQDHMIRIKMSVESKWVKNHK